MEFNGVENLSEAQILELYSDIVDSPQIAMECTPCPRGGYICTDFVNGHYSTYVHGDCTYGDYDYSGNDYHSHRLK